MNIPEMNAEHWEEFQQNIDANLSELNFQNTAYFKGNTVKWFQSEKEALASGFEPLILSKIQNISSSIISTKFEFIQNQYKLFIEARNALELIKMESTPPKKLLEMAKTTLAMDPKLNPIGKKLLEAAEAKFLALNEAQGVFECRALLIANTSFPEEHPLCNPEIPSSPMGCHFSRLDHGDLKGGNLQIVNKKTVSKEYLEGNLKISAPCRKQLEQQIALIEANIEQFKELSKSWGCKGIHISTVDDSYPKQNEGIFNDSEKIIVGKAIQIEFEGIGKIRIGNQPNVGSSYNRVCIELDPQVKSQDFLSKTNAMLTAIGFKDLLGTSDPDDIKKRKMMFLLHTYFPQHAFNLENMPDTFNLSSTDLKQKILKLVPEMETIFSHYENPDLIGTQEIYPGKTTVALKDLPEKIRQKGGVGLMMGVTVSKGTVWDAIAGILKNGALSTQDRYQLGFLVSGASSSTDYNSGGGENVFTRLITQEAIKQETKIDAFEFSGGAQILFDLDVLARGGYGYPFDSYGRKNRFDGNQEKYAQRKNLLEFTAEMNDTNEFKASNELMVKNRIPPRFIRGVVINSEHHKKMLIEKLRQEGLIVKINNQDTFNGKPLERFFIQSSVFKKEMWSKA